MAGLNVSLSFFFATFVLCQAARRACKALLPAGAYASFAREAMRMLAELGPWAGGFGPDLLLTLLTLLFLVHGATCDGAAANPTVSLQDFLLAEASGPRTLLKLAAQGLGVRAACALTRLYWAWELCDLHVLQNLLDPHCSSPLRTPVSHGALVEGAGAFFLHLTLLRLRTACPPTGAPRGWSVPPPTAGPFTSAFFNPALYMQVYWLGPLTGMVLAVLLYHGRLPRLFQRNLLYSQKNKYRTPRGKPARGLETPRRLQRGAEAGAWAGWGGGSRCRAPAEPARSLGGRPGIWLDSGASLSRGGTGPAVPFSPQNLSSINHS
uniref:Aquaporin n=1 Tax=Lynx canadensis TaxID=61383 RepID=A0A667HX89_LYNCA